MGSAIPVKVDVLWAMASPIGWAWADLEVIRYAPGSKPESRFSYGFHLSSFFQVPSLASLDDRLQTLSQ